ncbi:MAG: divergent polysaccharide deacetylase family protein, partial [Rhodospirillales bacterium]|nr:divergent polysaccharide deacetylase family protein [Rhodospirillales bacterium]
ELRRRLEWSFGRFSTYVGINNHMGSKFTSNSKAMSIVIEEIKNRGLLFLDSRTSSQTVGAMLARKMGVPVAERNIFLDHENTIEAVHAQLKKVEQLARSAGSVIAIGHPRDVTIRALREWLEGIEGRGFTLVPLTTLVLRHTNP